MEESKETLNAESKENDLEILREKIREHHIQEEQKLQAMAMMLRAKDPKRYERAQYMGNAYMNSGYELEIGFDNEGIKIKAEELIRLLKNELISEEELTEEDLIILNKIYENNWKNQLN